MTKKATIFLLTFWLMILILPVTAMHAAEIAASKSMTVTTKKGLKKALNDDSVTKITISTKKNITFDVSDVEGASSKKLVINAPNATIVNHASFDSIVIKAGQVYTEKASNNSITIKCDSLELVVGEGASISKLVSAGEQLEVTVKKNGNIGALLCDNEDGDITLKVGKKAKVKVVNDKEAKIDVGGSGKNNVNIVTSEADSSIESEQPASEPVAEPVQDEEMNDNSEAQNVQEENMEERTKLDPLGRVVPYDTDLSYFEVNHPGDLVAVLEYYRTVYDGEATVVLTENARFDYHTVWNETTGEAEGEFNQIWIGNKTHLIIQSGKHMTCVRTGIYITDNSSLSGDVTYVDSNSIVIMNGKLMMEGVEIEARLIAESPRESGDDGVWLTIAGDNGIPNCITCRRLHVGYICECNITGPQDKVNAYIDSFNNEWDETGWIYLRRNERGTGKLFVNEVEQTNIKILEYNPG